MGTRSLTLIKDYDGTEIAVLYRHHDGYPTGHGKDIKAALQGKKVSSGLGLDTTKCVNGAGDMAVQLIVHLKCGIGDVLASGPVKAGGLYLHPAGTRGLWERYVYEVICGKPGNTPTPIRLVVHGCHVIYDGPLDDFDPYAAESSDDDDEDVEQGPLEQPTGERLVHVTSDILDKR